MDGRKRAPVLFRDGHLERTVTLPDAAGRMALSFGEGTAVSTPEHNAGSGMRAMLDGPVREAAIVYVNGKRAGAVWCPPMRWK